MHKQWVSLALVLLEVSGFVLMNVGFWASNADKDPVYRKRTAPSYDLFISSAHSLQGGIKITKSDPMFQIYDALLTNEDSSLEIEEINKMDCGGVSLSSDGKTHSHCTFTLVLSDGKTKQVQVSDLQEKIDSALLLEPAYRLEKRTFKMGVVLQVVGFIVGLLLI